MASFSPNTQELALTAQIFAHADPQKLGALTGEVAVRVFGGANLPPTVLGEIWQIADESNNGWLSQKGVAMAVRLMGHAQKGEKVSTALLNKPGPLPTITGITPIAPQSTGASAASRAKSPGPSALPPFTPADKAKFHTMFLRSGPVDGLLSGEKAQDVFIKSKLPTETLGLIWNLADTQDRGKLDSTDFAIGMYLIQATMTGQLSSIPNALPPGFYQQVTGAGQSNIRPQATGGSYSPLASSFSQRSTIQPQYTGASQHLLQPQATGPWSSKPPVPPHLPARPSASAIGSGAFGASQPQWDVTPAEKANSDRWFDSLDTQKRGFIQDDVAVPFMLESKLSGDDLAQIWDLADINNDGRLTRDGFAIAWYLIQKKRNGVSIPASLPPSLMPPSMRAASASSPFTPVTPTPPKPQEDLFSWDEEPVVPPQPTPAPVSVFASQQQQQLSPQHTNTAFSSPPRSDPFGLSSQSAPAVHHDLLGDDDDTGASSPPIHDQSAEIGNVQNQVNSTSRSLASAQADRAALETQLANQAAQLSALQTQLSSAKAAYETETKLLAGLRERQSTQTADITKSREELIRAESDLSAVRVEKAEVEGAFLRDKEEARALHKKMVEASQQIDVLKVDVEKSKKEAKQQKGLLAIARKQLSTKEAERAKVEKELQEAQAEAAAVVAEKEEVESSIATLEAQPLPTLPAVIATAAPPERTTSSDSLAFAAAHMLPATPDAGSPLASSIKSNNPFERLVGNSTPRSQSPFAPAANGLASLESGTEGAAPALDPFGFAQAFGEDASAPPVPEVSVEPEPESKSIIPTPAELSTLSPASEATTDDGAISENDVFSTPLTATGPAFPAIHDVVETQFPPPPLETSESKIPGHFEPDPVLKEPATDLGSQLKELDVQDSDSSEDDSEDEVPLATLKKNAEVTEPEAPKANGDAQPPETSFDDVFGVSAPSTEPTPAAPAPAVESVTDAFGMAAMSNSPFGIPGNGFAPAPAVAGVTAFDEALGKLPAGSSPAAQFTTFDSAFDNSFDDTFDFGSSGATGATEAATAFPPAPTANGHTVSALPPSASKNEFDSIFASGSDSASAPAQPPASILSNGNGSTFRTPVSTGQPSQNGGGPSFDEAFAGFDERPELKNLTGTLGSPTTGAFPSGPSDTQPAGQAFPTVSPVPSPKTAVPPTRGATARSVSPPPRHRSPPPPRNTASSKGRSSTGSSKEEKTKEAPAPRHSKLSIRLPFGKKKNKQVEPLPSGPSQLLTPPREDAERTTVDDDVEAVKQLTAMGFSRIQAVDALEIYGYDVQKALNSLLGAQ
ncbi:hypothetical protein DFH07DRAFT_958946 [Mycena maculata]|uniref:Uncharacterized protein n=1 Tax=Mycena maculata TaxID=230809 RepID=A0AAD7J8I8_9AGAR|nr:hypothetical protein DFH07DRAFT_958946 [Mycena maculata]